MQDFWYAPITVKLTGSKVELASKCPFIQNPIPKNGEVRRTNENVSSKSENHILRKTVALVKRENKELFYDQSSISTHYTYSHNTFV